MEYELTVEGDGLEENHRYPVYVEAQRLTEAECQQLIERAKQEIDSTFYSDGDNADHVTNNVCMKSTYVSGQVSASWVLSDYSFVDTEGNLCMDDISEDGEIITAEVELTCSEVKEVYIFPFHVYPRELSGVEKLIKDINAAIDTENEKAGEEYITLPKQVDGVKLTWNTVKERMTLKILLLEIAGIALLIFADKKQQQEKKKKRQESMRLDYGEIVSKMAILLGSGMSVKESWRRISATQGRPVYEEMKMTIREIEDGVTEKNAYQNFADRVELSEYHRFIRLLVSNMQKGNRSICMVLEEEAVSAYEQRRMLIKKLGEEAGTKMLIPLMVMLMLVMAIIMIPAILSF